MNITINLEGVTEGKNYTVEFTVYEGTSKSPSVRSSQIETSGNTVREEKDGTPSLSEFEPEAPKLGDPKSQPPKEIKIESSFGKGRINPN